MKLLLIFVNLFVVVMNMVNGFTISQDSSGITCDKYKCPANSASCIISEKTQPDLTKIDYVRQCIDNRGNVLDKFENTYNNPYPGSSVNNYVSSGGSSYITTNQNRFGGTDNLTKEELQKIQEETEKRVNDALQSANQQRDYWQKWNEDFQRKLAKDLSVIKYNY